MVGTRTDDPIRVAVIGDRIPDLAPQETIEPALAHAAGRLGTAVDVTWFDTPPLQDDAADALAAFDAVWCAPGSPFRSLEGALAGIRFAREAGRPFLGTCAGFQHGVIEFARNVLGIAEANHAEYGAAAGTASLFIDELLCSLVGQTLRVKLVDTAAREVYGGVTEAEERYYCRFGLREEFTPALAAAGLVVAGADAEDGTTRILRLDDAPFHWLTLFVPQTASTPERPHPIVSAFVAAAVRLRVAAGARA